MGLSHLAGDAVGEAPEIMTGIAARAGAVLGPAGGTAAHVGVVVEHYGKEIASSRMVCSGKGFRLAVEVIPGCLPHVLKKARGCQAGLYLARVVTLFHTLVTLGAEPLGVRLAERISVIVEGMVGVVYHTPPVPVAYPVEQADTGIYPRLLEFLSLVNIGEVESFGIDVQGID